MPRNTPVRELQADENPQPPASPLRRSTRIASPGPKTLSLSLRRSSVSDDTYVPAIVPKRKRLSLSLIRKNDNEKQEKPPDTPTPNRRFTRSCSKSPTRDDKQVSSKTGTFSKIIEEKGTAELDESPPDTPTPSRSVTPKLFKESEPPSKPKTRRSSVSDRGATSLDVIFESPKLKSTLPLEPITEFKCFSGSSMTDKVVYELRNDSNKKIFGEKQALAETSGESSKPKTVPSIQTEAMACVADTTGKAASASPRKVSPDKKEKVLRKVSPFISLSSIEQRMNHSEEKIMLKKTDASPKREESKHGGKMKSPIVVLQSIEKIMNSSSKHDHGKCVVSGEHSVIADKTNDEKGSKEKNYESDKVTRHKPSKDYRHRCGTMTLYDLLNVDYPLQTEKTVESSAENNVETQPDLIETATSKNNQSPEVTTSTIDKTVGDQLPIVNIKSHDTETTAVETEKTEQIKTSIKHINIADGLDGSFIVNLSLYNTTSDTSLEGIDPQSIIVKSTENIANISNASANSAKENKSHNNESLPKQLLPSKEKDNLSSAAAELDKVGKIATENAFAGNALNEASVENSFYEPMEVEYTDITCAGDTSVDTAEVELNEKCSAVTVAVPPSKLDGVESEVTRPVTDPKEQSEIDVNTEKNVTTKEVYASKVVQSKEAENLNEETSYLPPGDDSIKGSSDPSVVDNESENRDLDELNSQSETVTSSTNSEKTSAKQNDICTNNIEDGVLKSPSPVFSVDEAQCLTDDDAEKSENISEVGETKSLKEEETPPKPMEIQDDVTFELEEQNRGEDSELNGTAVKDGINSCTVEAESPTYRKSEKKKNEDESCSDGDNAEPKEGNEIGPRSRSPANVANTNSKKDKFSKKSIPQDLTTTADNIVEDIDDLEARVEALIEKEMEVDDLNVAETNEEEQCHNPFIDDMAEEGEEDTPSPGSNDLSIEGEWIGSTDTTSGSEGSYLQDSFIECNEEQSLLSGEETYLEDEKLKKDRNKKPKRTRIFPPSDSEEEPISEAKMSKVQDSVPIKPLNAEVCDSNDTMSTDPYVRLTPPSHISIQESSSDTVTEIIINNDDNLKSLEAMNADKSASQQVITQADSVICLDSDDSDVSQESCEASSDVQISSNEQVTPTLDKLDLNVSTASKVPNTKLSISVHENVKFEELQDGTMSEKLSRVMDLFCTNYKQSSNIVASVSLNVSLDHADNLSDRHSTELDDAATDTAILKTKLLKKRTASTDSLIGAKPLHKKLKNVSSILNEDNAEEPLAVKNIKRKKRHTREFFVRVPGTSNTTLKQKKLQRTKVSESSDETGSMQETDEFPREKVHNESKKMKRKEKKMKIRAQLEAADETSDEIEDSNAKRSKRKKRVSEVRFDYEHEEYEEDIETILKKNVNEDDICTKKKKKHLPKANVAGTSSGTFKTEKTEIEEGSRAKRNKKKKLRKAVTSDESNENENEIETSQDRDGQKQSKKRSRKVKTDSISTTETKMSSESKAEKVTHGKLKRRHKLDVGAGTSVETGESITYFPSRKLDELGVQEVPRMQKAGGEKKSKRNRQAFAVSTGSNSNSWVCTPLETVIVPSKNVFTSEADPSKLAKKFKPSGFTEPLSSKDFKNKMLFDSRRVKRVSSKKLKNM